MTERATAVALAELQLDELTPAATPPAGLPAAIAEELLTFLSRAPTVIADVVIATLRDLARLGFAAGDLTARRQLLERLRGQQAWRGRLAVVTRLVWLVIHSDSHARAVVGFRDPKEFAPHEPKPDLAQPPEPSLDQVFDACVIGSGAGGGVVATRLAEAGKRVLIVERGRWISPHLLPTRDDHALQRLFHNSGVNPAVPDELQAIADICNNEFAAINVLQASVVGGGPYINNAILLPMRERIWQQWHDAFDFPIAWETVAARMELAERDLAAVPPGPAAGGRSDGFRRGGVAGGFRVRDLPLAVWNCLGCGGCNVGCRFGRKTGGLHGPRPPGAPRSYLERALAAGAEIRPGFDARKLQPASFGSNRVGTLVGRDVERPGIELKVKAKVFVVAAGPIASSRLLAPSLPGVDYPPGLGISANIVSPVFAVMPGAVDGAPDPGIQMCYFVDPGGDLLLESWFHYPASLSVAVPGWLSEHAATMRLYPRLAASGVVVPSAPRGRLGALTEVVLALGGDELEALKRGVGQLAELYFAAGAETVIPATGEPLPIRRAHQVADLDRFMAAVTRPADLSLGTAHPQGGNRIGPRAQSSVVDARFHVHGVRNLFVADASLFPAGCGVNPQLTAMALAHLAADQVLGELG